MTEIVQVPVLNKSLYPLTPVYFTQRHESRLVKALLIETEFDALFSDFLFKLLVIGDSGVGKSCLLLRFAVIRTKITHLLYHVSLNFPLSRMTLILTVLLAQLGSISRLKQSISITKS